jgi:putative transposase
MDLYHALNRGVDKRTIFLDDQDRARFIHDMYEFNSTEPAKNIFRKQMCDIVSRSFSPRQEGSHFTPREGKQIVDIHGWCLMDNHYHLLLSEKMEGGLSQFLRKLNVGYAKYFNERYIRVGTLFQGRTKKILIDSDAYMLHILNYIHLNPLDFMENTNAWRSRTITDHQAALDFLKEYRWSSYQDYAGIKNFPSILTKDFFQDVFGAQYTQQLEKYLQDIDTSEIKHLLHE